ncbi:MAG TPA: hypothetical protein ENG63_08970 [Candidatus Desulfofervidus auxilii]|uniref:DUF2791 family P-loop domain-containing protein n=1 Tax=Desulfofervidus auxilii TaxID=1621989 RepID=A0A7C0YAI7_DESA2|nr:ATP-binding protein [Candidatus Desulfofervidus auxilii]HDD44971.1 hypothetical protein [Candidatus Desulfofervidus auxilii]
MQLDTKVARRIIETVGAYGTPPEYGFQFFTAGLDDYLRIIHEEYLKTYIKEGGSVVKIVVGAYGGGKTHFLYSIRELAWQENFAVSYVSLSPEESPFHRLEAVYRAIVNNLTYPLSPEDLLKGTEKGIESFIIAWYERQSNAFHQAGLKEDTLEAEIDEYLSSIKRTIENTNFANAVAEAFLALHREEEKVFRQILQWLKAEGYERDWHRQFGILTNIDRSNAFSMIRSLAQWILNIGYSGLVILFDEAEQIPSLSTRQRELTLSNLRELIDACMDASFRHVMIFYALPDERFFEGPSHIYEALKQRISSVFDFFNPSGVKIKLEKAKEDPVLLLEEIGYKLKHIYEIAYGIRFPSQIEDIIHVIAQEAYERRFGDIGYIRLFVQGIIKAFHLLRHNPHLVNKAEEVYQMLEEGGA